MERECFDLGDVHGRWHGLLLIELRAPLEKGLAATRARLAGAGFAVVVLLSDFWIDGLLESVLVLEGAATREAAEQMAGNVRDTEVAKLLQARSGWRVDPLLASPHWHWPAPRQVAGSRLLGGHLESAYVRVWIHERAVGENGLDALLSGWPAEMQSEIVFWLIEEGRRDLRSNIS